MRRRFAAVAAVFLLGVALTGCATSTPGEDGDVLPPVTVQISDLEGTTVEVPEGGVINLSGDEADVEGWTAKVSDDSIVSFVEGRDDGSAVYNPGLEAKKVGSTEVLLANPDAGESVSFTVEVTPKS
ncbi:hypothetical protein MN032_04385 [Agromyces atrinae]|uniref:hypothetical protein n=1 Tax=Agromyces atrinae TaxID=592376 RepID=UPI001F58D72B|nr:hypothetical protein [Agromyces atrinae]MCI2956922.1 hypothetical protein [Agromyces atrinae]